MRNLLKEEHEEWRQSLRNEAGLYMTGTEMREEFVFALESHLKAHGIAWRLALTHHPDEIKTGPVIMFEEYNSIDSELVKTLSEKLGPRFALIAGLNDKKTYPWVHLGTLGMYTRNYQFLYYRRVREEDGYQTVLIQDRPPDFIPWIRNFFARFE